MSDTSLRHTLSLLVGRAVEQLQQEGVIPGDVGVAWDVERPREKSHGDFSTNAAMVLARHARKNPRELAERLLAALPVGEGLIQKCQVAGPGFINFFLQPQRWLRMVEDIRHDANFGHSTVGQGQKVQVEFVSANPTGPMHLGHGRGAVTGDVICRLLQAVGVNVEREYYINDAGNQVRVLGLSVLLRYHELLGHEVTIPEGCYPAEYVIDIARALMQRDGEKWQQEAVQAAQGSDTPPEEVVAFAVEEVMGWIRNDLSLLDIHFDHYFSEKQLHRQGGIEHAIDLLRQKDLIYQGILEPPKGKVPDDWEAKPQLLFRATRSGDDSDRPLQKSDGSYTYFAADIAYHLNKAERGFNQLVNVWGADHGGYVPRVKAALHALTGRKDLLDVKLVQMVNLNRGGKPVRMSKRSGNFVTLRDLTEEVGRDVVRFWFLTRAGDSHLDFDLDLAVSKSNDNPVFYVQYAHARLCSVWRQLEEKGWQFDSSVNHSLEPLQGSDEMDLIRLLSQFPEVVEGAALAHEPHRLTYYLLEVAAAFHTYYNGHRLLEEDATVRNARLSLGEAVRRVLANGLQLMGIEPQERM
ncbi:MAG: arginine--tRNA ligase [Magnetococcales bacterium]|nr:arginine--tRNA ligase [Magnetococcales bacterium]NGZ26388.1 arginine--tRNA ligase [Magnetococcales bacterium]